MGLGLVLVSTTHLCYGWLGVRSCHNAPNRGGQGVEFGGNKIDIENLISARPLEFETGKLFVFMPVEQSRVFFLVANFQHMTLPNPNKKPTNWWGDANHRAIELENSCIVIINFDPIEYIL